MERTGRGGPLRRWRRDVEDVLQKFGERLAEMGRPLWDVQAKALAKASYITTSGMGKKGDEKRE